MAKPAPRSKTRDTGRRGKKKVSVLIQEKIEYVDWKDVDLLRRFVSDRAKIRARRVTGNDTQQQRDIARAVKIAREMALLPYTNRVTQHRGGGRRGEGRDREGGGRRGEGRERETSLSEAEGFEPTRRDVAASAPVEPAVATPEPVETVEAAPAVEEVGGDE